MGHAMQRTLAMTLLHLLKQFFEFCSVTILEVDAFECNAPQTPALDRVGNLGVAAIG